MNLKISIADQNLKTNRSILSKDDDDDENFLIGLIGTNRSGKSAVARKLAEDWRRSNPDVEKNRIISFDPQRKFQDISTNHIFSHDKDWCGKLLKMRNALIILDDYRLIHKKSRAMEEFEELMSFRAEYNLDIIYICHNPALVINTLCYFTNFYFIFLTNAQEGGFERKIPSYSLCEKAAFLVADYVKYFGKGYYDKEKQYPNFPHVIVNTQKATLIGRNIDIDKYNEHKNQIKERISNQNPNK